MREALPIMSLLEEALPLADIIVWVASLPKGVEIDPDKLKRPCIIIDGGYPKNLGTVLNAPDISVIKGGIVEHSLDIDWKIMKIVNMDIPSRQMFACFAEAILLELEGWQTNFSWGRNQITVPKMEQIGAASRKHGHWQYFLTGLSKVKEGIDQAMREIEALTN